MRDIGFLCGAMILFMGFYIIRAEYQRRMLVKPFYNDAISGKEVFYVGFGTWQLTSQSEPVLVCQTFLTNKRGEGRLRAFLAKTRGHHLTEYSDSDPLHRMALHLTYDAERLEQVDAERKGATFNPPKSMLLAQPIIGSWGDDHMATRVDNPKGSTRVFLATQQLGSAPPT